MDDRELKMLKKALPKNIRLKRVPADLEGPAEIVLFLPDVFVLQSAAKRGFMGFHRYWKTFALIEQYWPADADDLIQLYDTNYDYLLQAALRKAGLDNKVKIISKET